MAIQTHVTQGPALSKDELFLVDQAVDGTAQPQWNLYYSRVRFAVTAVSTTPFQYTIGATSNLAFGYSQGQVGTAGGLTTTATAADTSLQNPGQTINGEFVLIRGISLFLLGQSDPLLAKAISPLVAVSAAFGATAYALGIPDMLPGFGGLTGMSESNIVNPNLYEQFSKCIGGISNGAPLAGNTTQFPRSLIWMPAGKGSTANFNVKLQTFASATLLSNMLSATRTAGTAGATYNGAPSAWTNPTLASASVYVDYLVVLNHVPFYLK